MRRDRCGVTPCGGRDALEAQLKEWGIDVEKFRARADKAKTKAKVKLNDKVATLRAKWMKHRRSWRS